MQLELRQFGPRVKLLLFLGRCPHSMIICEIRSVREAVGELGKSSSVMKRGLTTPKLAILMARALLHRRTFALLATVILIGATSATGYRMFKRTRATIFLSVDPAPIC